MSDLMFKDVADKMNIVVCGLCERCTSGFKGRTAPQEDCPVDCPVVHLALSEYAMRNAEFPHVCRYPAASL